MVEKTAHDPEFEALLDYIHAGRGGFRRLSRAAGGAARRVRGSAQHRPDHLTSFFRDAEAWAVLREKVIPDIIERVSDGGPIRVWSVGCASGEEPYSIAMLFAEAMGVAQFCQRVKIYATDLDEEALKTARLATYPPRDVGGVPPELLEIFRAGQNQYVFGRDLRKCVIFGRHNFVHDAPISRIDLLTCRNLLIYLEAETQNAVLPRLHYALNQEGYMFLGKAETQLGRSPLFRAVGIKHRIFAKVHQKWRHPIGVHRWPCPVFHRAPPHQYLAVADQHMLVRPGDLDVARLHRLAIYRGQRGQLPRPIEQMRQHAFGGWRQMLYNEYVRRQLCR